MADDDTLIRPLFFDRQNLRAEDLNALVDWMRDSRRRFNRHAIGWGVLSGLPVSPVAGQPWAVQVGAGFAIAPTGAEIAVPAGAAPYDICPEARACLGIPGPCPNPGDLTDTGFPEDLPAPVNFADPGHPEVDANPRDVGWATIQTDVPGADDQTRIMALDQFTALLLGVSGLIQLADPMDEITVIVAHTAKPATVTARDAAGNIVDTLMQTVDPMVPQSLRLTGAGIQSVEINADGNAVFLLGLAPSSPVMGEVYLALCPFDQLAAPRPAVPEACREPNAEDRFSRVCESYRLKILCDLPAGNAPPGCDEVEALVCTDSLLPVPPSDGDCVVIATIEVGRTGILGIDEFRDRRQLLPMWLQARRHACQCGVPAPSTPPPSPTPTPTPPTQFTRATAPTIFTQPSEFTLFSQPSFFTGGPSFFTGPSVFTGPSFFTGGPSFFTDMNPFSEFVNPGDPFDPGPMMTEFDPAAGRDMAVTDLTDIGPSRSGRLAEIGITNLTDFIGASSETLSETLGMSEVRVAELQAEARNRTRRGGP
ncbi:hypothetical protein RGUI_3677 [Rhodovulum sp. P5]|uniref:hypothetical protein n=1 Tax=Rhodovulum sp. P5 TaxID=1564506 RepID=UPI0009C1E732|nr:hypothetical protein [Rhodovulum sp. P5]ARE41818.1 hypothetical protein RGUI_3677 [Rhodovulum sp. P5]